MTGRRTIVGLSLLCALVFSAFSVASASAAPGATAFTCAPVVGKAGTKGFSDAHCLTATEGAGVKFEHVEIGNEPTLVRGQNLNTEGKRVPPILTTTAAGLATEITCEILETNGKLTNLTPAAEQMGVHGTEGVATYKNCTVPKPVGQNCKIKEGGFSTVKLTSTTFHEGAKLGSKITPEAGEVFVSLTFEGCKTAGLNTTYPIKGFAVTTPSGTTLESKPEDGALTFGGAAAKLTQIQTLKMLNGAVEEAGVALTTTNN